ncbi:MAG: acetylxylan esterase [Propionibacteriaceae bacterium]
MAFFDLPLDQLQEQRPTIARPDDLDAFWTRTLDAELSRPLEARVVPVDTPLKTLDVYDVSWVGYGGQRVQAWLRVPAGATEPLPTVLHYRGYSGGRGYPFVESEYASAGYAHFLLESRGQGWRTPSLTAPTPDLDPAAGDMHYPGLMTRGITDPGRYYYRRLYVDAVRMLQLAAQDSRVDATRIAALGTSQGGGLTIAVAGLAALAGLPLAAALPNVPFLCHFRRAVGLTDANPYAEIAQYLAAHPAEEARAFTTLSYFDGANLGGYAKAPALFSTAGMDEICPPSTVYAAYHAWGNDDKEITYYPWNGHEGGGDHHTWHTLTWLAERFGTR